MGVGRVQMMLRSTGFQELDSFNARCVTNIRMVPAGPEPAGCLLYMHPLIATRHAMQLPIKTQPITHIMTYLHDPNIAVSQTWSTG